MMQTEEITALKINGTHMAKELQKLGGKVDKVLDILHQYELKFKDFVQFKGETEVKFLEQRAMYKEIVEFMHGQKAMLKLTKIAWGILSSVIIALATIGTTLYQDVKSSHETITQYREEI